MSVDTLAHIKSILANKAPAISTVSGSGGIVTMRRNLRSAVRGLWSGALTREQALRVFRLGMERGIEAAWVEGAAECGIQPDELTVEELTKRDEFIFEQNDLAPNFIDAIAVNSKANGGSLTPLLQRNEMWVNQYESAKTIATTEACKDIKLLWVLGPVDQSCRSCLKLSGQVRRASFWKNNVLPRNGPNKMLACQGFRCLCSLQKTDKPLTKGRLPKLP